jgi:nucleoid DNA-binding protein
MPKVGHVNKSVLVANLVLNTGLSHAACEEFLEGLAVEVGVALIFGKSITLPGIGKLELKQLSARSIRTPQGVVVDVPTRAAVKFRAALPREMMRQILSEYDRRALKATPGAEA